MLRGTALYRRSFVAKLGIDFWAWLGHPKVTIGSWQCCPEGWGEDDGLGRCGWGTELQEN